MLKLAAAFAALVLLATPSYAAPCRDVHGKFVKCPPKPKKVVRCKDAKGKFATCGKPGTRPV
jgi:hypothetical protein